VIKRFVKTFKVISIKNGVDLNEPPRVRLEIRAVVEMPKSKTFLVAHIATMNEADDRLYDFCLYEQKIHRFKE
jgi:hypothetical protein